MQVRNRQNSLDATLAPRCTGRVTLLAEIGARAAYRLMPDGEAENFPTVGALAPAVRRLRREAVSLREIAQWPGLSLERASRLLNALYSPAACWSREAIRRHVKAPGAFGASWAGTDTATRYDRAFAPARESFHMATSLIALLDDIASVLDDVAALTKVATKKTAGVLGDDLALNAQQVTGLDADRELPVVWAVAKGSAANKAILVPAALAISAFAPWAVMPLLMIGGAYLCFEGFEKVAHRLLHAPTEDAAHHAEHLQAVVNPSVDMVAFEKQKIKGAVRTDFILSAEIIAITLGAVAEAAFVTQVAVLVGIAALMTVGVYGLVAAIVKIDDAGLALSRRAGALARGAGRLLLGAAPWLMKGLSVAGTAAMFLVGGGIVVHGIGPLHHAVEEMAQAVGALGPVLEALMNGLAGVATGALVLAGVIGVQRLRPRAAA